MTRIGLLVPLPPPTAWPDSFPQSPVARNVVQKPFPMEPTLHVELIGLIFPLFLCFPPRRMTPANLSTRDPWRRAGFHLEQPFHIPVPSPFFPLKFVAIETFIGFFPPHERNFYFLCSSFPSFFSSPSIDPSLPFALDKQRPVLVTAKAFRIRHA